MQVVTVHIDTHIYLYIMLQRQLNILKDFIVGAAPALVTPHPVVHRTHAIHSNMQMFDFKLIQKIYEGIQIIPVGYGPYFKPHLFAVTTN